MVQEVDGYVHPFERISEQYVEFATCVDQDFRDDDPIH